MAAAESDADIEADIDDLETQLIHLKALINAELARLPPITEHEQQLLTSLLASQQSVRERLERRKTELATLMSMFVPFLRYYNNSFLHGRSTKHSRFVAACLDSYVLKSYV